MLCELWPRRFLHFSVSAFYLAVYVFHRCSQYSTVSSVSHYRCFICSTVYSVVTVSSVSPSRCFICSTVYSVVTVSSVSPYRCFICSTVYSVVTVLLICFTVSLFYLFHRLFCSHRFICFTVSLFYMLLRFGIFSAPPLYLFRHHFAVLYVDITAFSPFLRFAVSCICSPFRCFVGLTVSLFYLFQRFICFVTVSLFYRFLCPAGNCADQYVQCRFWARAADYCSSEYYGHYMGLMCPQSCNFCNDGEWPGAPSLSRNVRGKTSKV